MLGNPFGEEIFPDVQSKPPLVQLETIFSCPTICNLGKETNNHLTTTSFQVLVETGKVSPLLQAEQPQVSQQPLVRQILKTCHQLHCSSLDTLQHLNVFVVARGQKLITVFEVQPHQC